MPEMAPLTSITVSAFRVAWRRRFLWRLALPVSVLIGINSHVAREIQHTFLDSTDRSHWFSLLTDSATLTLFGLVVLVSLLQSAIRGPIILFLEHGYPHDAKVKRKGVSRSEMLRAIFVSATFDVLYWFTLLIVATVIAVPCFIAWQFNPSVLTGILEFGALILFTLGVYLSFIKELACLYALLGNVRLSSAVDLGFRLYRRQAFNTLLFFSYAVLLAILFAVFVGSLISAVGLARFQAGWLVIIASSLPFGLYTIFDQSLRLSFFHSVATTPKKPALKEIALEPSESQSGVAPS
ncbi:MAG: hypothetical protein WBB68_05355 [Candidatus Moraniibacteriota bacterium]